MTYRGAEPYAGALKPGDRVRSKAVPNIGAPKCGLVRITGAQWPDMLGPTAIGVLWDGEYPRIEYVDESAVEKIG